MSSNLPAPVPEPPPGEFLLYQSEGGQTRLRVRFFERTVWLSQKALADLFQVTVANVNQHLKAIYSEGELRPEATIKRFLIVQAEGSRQIERLVDHYNLEAILAVGYRVRSPRGTQFRQWATANLRELLVKGFVLDDERLKAGKSLGEDYFDELLARIRDIRASERRFYQKIMDIYATSIDYDASADITKTFYATVQNKLHWAIHGHTAAEIVVRRADASKPNMGLSTWKNAPAGPIRKTDVSIAKNYLSEEELTQLNRIVTMYLDFAEFQAQKRQPMHMTDWVAKLDAFLQFNEQNILRHAGKVSHEVAEQHAERQFALFDAERRRLEATQPTSDFDRAVEEVKRLEAEKKKPATPKKAPDAKKPPAKPPTKKKRRPPGDKK